MEPLATMKVKGIFHENDTLNELLRRLGDQAGIVEVGNEVYKSYKQLGKDLRAKLGDKALNRALVVAKTVIVKANERYALFTGLAGDEYRKDLMGRVLGVDSEAVLQSATHRNIATEKLVGRVHGECSIILHSEYLKLFEGVIISDAFDKELRKIKAKPIVAYPVGYFHFFWADGKAFLDTFGQMVELRKESEV